MQVVSHFYSDIHHLTFESRSLGFTYFASRLSQDGNQLFNTTPKCFSLSVQNRVISKTISKSLNYAFDSRLKCLRAPDL